MVNVEKDKKNVLVMAISSEAREGFTIGSLERSETST